MAKKFHEKYKETKSWLVKVKIVSIYHSLKKLQMPDWKVSGTAKYFSISIGNASENIWLSKHIPLIKDCKSRNAALKLLRKRK